MSYLPILIVIAVVIGVQLMLERSRSRRATRDAKPATTSGARSATAPPSAPSSGVPPLSPSGSYAVVVNGPDPSLAFVGGPLDVTLEVHEPGMPPRTVRTTLHVPDGKGAWLTPGLRLPITVAPDGAVAIAWDRL